MADVTPLEVDRREPDIIINKLKFTKPAGRELSITEMQTGDYRFIRSQEGKKPLTVLIERATWSNFLQKISNGEIVEQLRRALFMPDTLTILLLEGVLSTKNDEIVLDPGFKNKIKTGWKYAPIGNALLSFQLLGCVLAFTSSQDDTAIRLWQIYEYMSKDDHEILKKPYNQYTSFSMVPPTKQEQALMMIPKVGPQIAKNLIREFGTIAEVARASSKQLADVPQVGPSIAEIILEFLNG